LKRKSTREALKNNRFSASGTLNLQRDATTLGRSGNAQAVVRSYLQAQRRRGIETCNLEWMFSNIESACQERGTAFSCHPERRAAKSKNLLLVTID
jgi:hypothetical protein